MRKKRYIFLGFAVTFFSIALLSQNQLFAKSSSDLNISRLESLTKFTKVVNSIEKYYVDELTLDAIVDKAIEGMLTNLDAHSSFLTQKKYKELKIQTEGEFGGLGITVGIKDGALTVIAPIEGTPADKAGLKSGDIILKINEQSTLNMTIDEAVNIMRGKPKTKINLTVVRKNERKPLDFSIVRDIIKVNSVYTKDIEKHDDMLYVRVTSFDKNVVEKVKESIDKSKNRVKGIILDLRNNPGGLLDQAIGLCDLFISDGVIVSQKGRNKEENREYKATPFDTYEDLSIVVLVNDGSASASEIVSGALQDHKRAVVVGEKTFGKGSVQVIMPVGDDEALRLTIARYYLPSGRTIQAEGVTPDIIVEPGEVPKSDDKFSIKEAELKKHLEAELEKIDDVDNNKSKKASDNITADNSKTITQKDIYTDIQLKSAIDILKSIILLQN
ncbi:MAG: S41 family peptidase [Campylobacterales bacterium]|nr:S41 family peptidase [Campylobacterales bacterium]